MSRGLNSFGLHVESRSRQMGGLLRTGVRLAAWILLPLGAAGCAEESGPSQFPVSGQVTIDGKPLEVGSITFIPSVSGPAASGSIAAGTFKLDKPQGPGEGTYKVEIVSVQPTGKTVASPDDPGETIEETRNIIPARYNANTQLTVQVKSDGDNAFRFDISSAESKSRQRRRR